MIVWLMMLESVGDQRVNMHTTIIGYGYYLWWKHLWDRSDKMGKYMKGRVKLDLYEEVN